MSKPIAGLNLSADEIRDAWIYVFARYLVIRQEQVDLAENGVDYNVLKHNPSVVGSLDTGSAPTFVNPNLDVVYSEAWIGVDAQTPALLTVPVIPEGTYYTAQVVDEWAEIITNINDRVTPEHPAGTFAFFLAGTSPEIPEGAYPIELPSQKAKLLIRVQIKDDLNTAVDLQHQFSLHSTGHPAIPPTVDVPGFPNTRPLGAGFFTQPRLSAALAAPDRSGTADHFVPLTDALAEFVAGSSDNAKLVDDYILGTVFPEFVKVLTKLSTPINGWTTTGDRSGFGSDVAFRAAANFGGIWWNVSTEVIYLILHTDSDGHVPDGTQRYQQHFTTADRPGDHVDGYWSITMYTHPEVMLVPNDAGRYRISYASNLAYDDGGGFTLHYGPNLPPGVDIENWLPTPDGQFAVVFRTYLPKEDVRTSAWTPPPLVRQNS